MPNNITIAITIIEPTQNFALIYQKIHKIMAPIIIISY